ncbi:RidA family protein [Sapientia aquatica]|uniref:RidA family protein n=1 Tax=Sapientia aquatica TaxID=1549640 RepID=A0A4R5W2Y3_9BURK|nr:RidA family protein [Sapientia aquatica]TDK66644.1 RidA family protein [Sapientia aquatica]
MNITRFEMGPRFSEMTVVDLGNAKLIYLAGQVAQNTSLDVSGQTREVLQYIDQLLAKVGADKTNIVAARIYLASTGDYAVMNAVWDDWVPQGHTPARTTIGTRLVNHEYKVEIEVTAAINSSAAS